MAIAGHYRLLVTTGSIVMAGYHSYHHAGLSGCHIISAGINATQMLIVTGIAVTVNNCYCRSGRYCIGATVARYFPGHSSLQMAATNVGSNTLEPPQPAASLAVTIHPYTVRVKCRQCVVVAGRQGVRGGVAGR